MRNRIVMMVLVTILDLAFFAVSHEAVLRIR